MPTTGKFDVVTRFQDGRDEARLYSRGSHASNHYGGLAQKTGERCINMDLAIANVKGKFLGNRNARHPEGLPCLHKRGCPFLGPRWLDLHPTHRIELSVPFAFLTDNNNADTTTIEIPCSEWADATDTTRAKVDGVRSALG
jgi:hypothetical protein